jgi:hypothetical protein
MEGWREEKKVGTYRMYPPQTKKKKKRQNALSWVLSLKSCNPGYSGGRDQGKIMVQIQPRQKFCNTQCMSVIPR